MSMKLDAIIDNKTLQASIQRGVREYNRKFASKETLKLKIDDKGFRQPLGRITGDLQMFDSALAASNARVIAFGASTAVIGGISKAFKDLAKTTIEVGKTFADINRILQISTKNFESFGNQLFNISKKNATSFQDTTKAALEFARQGLKTEETLKRTSDALTLVRLTGINADKAVSSLTATVNAFDNAMVTTTSSVNKFVAVETKFAVGARDLVEAIGRVGSSAKDAKVGFDELNAIVTSVQQTTGRGGAVIGNAMKTIFTRLQRQSTLEALESYNVAVKDIQGNTLPAIQILNNFAQSYKGLTDANQAYLREQVAGVFQANILSAILRDLGKQQSTFGSALKVSTAATNEADKATAQLNKTLSALASQTASEFKRLQENIGKQTFEPIAKAILDPLKGLMEGINELIDGEGAGSEIANGLLKGIKNVIGGPGLVLIGGILLKVFTNTIGYIGKALPQLVGMTTETQKRATIEQFVSTVLAKEVDLAKAIAVNEGNAAEQAKLLLGYAKQTATQFDSQEASVNNIVNKLMQNPAAFAAINVATTGKTSKGKGAPRGAGGYMPGMLAEATDIKNGVGGVKKSAMPVSIPNFAFGGGKRGPMIANTGEYIVPNFQGGGSAIFNPNMVAAYGLPSGAKQIRGAGGYVPNFADVNIASVNKAISDIEGGAYIDPTTGKDIKSKMVADANKASGLNIPADSARSTVLQKLTKKKVFLQGQSIGTNLDGRGFASMLVPQVGANDPNYRYNFKNAKTRKQAGILLGGKSGPINSVTFGVYGLDPNAPSDLKKGGNLAKVDEILDKSLVSAANKVFKSYSPSIGDIPANKERIEKEFLLEGGQGAMEAFKGALFEGLVNRLIGQNLDKKGNTLDVFLDAGGASGKRAKDLFGINTAVQFADVKSNSGSGNKGKFVKQLLSNAKMLPPMAAARGYVPNFAALGDAVEREAAAGVPLGSIRVGRSSKLTSPNNPAGLAVTNTRDEPRGLKDVVGASRGYVPNYAFNLPGGLTVQKGKGHAKLLEDAQKKLAKQLNDAINDYRKGNINRDKLNATTQKLIADMKFTATAEKKVAASLNRRVAAVDRLNTSSGAGGGLMGRASALNKKMAAGPMGGMGGMMASMALPMLAGGVEQAFGEGDSTGQGLSGALSGAGTGAMIGSFFGPLGTAIGGAVGGIAGLSYAAMNAGKSLEQLERETQEYEQATAATTGAAEQYIQAQEDLATAITPEELEDAQKRLAKNFDAIKDVDLQNSFSEAGTNVGEMVRKLKEYELRRTAGAVAGRAAANAAVLEEKQGTLSRNFDALLNFIVKQPGSEGKSFGGALQGEDALMTERDLLVRRPRRGGGRGQTLMKDAQGNQIYDMVPLPGNKFYEIDDKALGNLRDQFGEFFEVMSVLNEAQMKELSEMLDTEAQSGDFDADDIARLLVGMNAGFADKDLDNLEAIFQKLEDASDGRLFRTDLVETQDLKGFADLVARVAAFTSRSKDVTNDISAAAAEALESFQDIRNSMSRFAEIMARTSSFAAGLGKLRSAYGGAVSGIFSQAGAGITAANFRATQEDKSLNEKISSASTKFAADNVVKILDTIKKAGAAVGDDKLRALDEAASAFVSGTDGSITDALDKFSEFTTENKKANQTIVTLIDSLRNQYDLQQRNFDIEEAILKGRQQLELEKAKNVFEEKALAQKQFEVLQERKRTLLQEQKTSELRRISLQAQIDDPRTFRGMRTTRAIATRQSLQRQISDEDFRMQRQQLDEQSIKRIADAQMAKQQLDSRLDLISSQDVLAEKIQELTDALRQEQKLLGNEKLREAELRSSATREIALKNQASIIGPKQNPDLYKTGPYKSVRERIEREAEEERRKINQKYDARAKDMISPTIERMTSGQSDSAVDVGTLPALRIRANTSGLPNNQYYSLQKEAAEASAEILRNAKSEEDIMTRLEALKRIGNEQDKNSIDVFNDTIEKIKQEVSYGYESLAIEQEKARARQDAANAIEKANDEEAKSFTRSMGAGFDDLFKDIDYIYGRLGKDLPKQFRDGMVQALETSMDKAESFGDAMRGFAVDFLKIIRRASLEYSMSNFTSLIGMGVSSDFRERMVHEQRGGLIHARNGMYISDGAPSGDSVPAMLEKGEYVLNRKAVAGMGGKAAVDSVNFGMFPRQGGGSMMLNESIKSPRMSGLFLASDNPELAEEREKAAERERKRQEKRAEKDAMKRQFLSTLLSTAASTAVAGFSNFAQGRIQDAKAAKSVETATGGKLTKSGNFITGYNIEGSDADVAAFRAQSTFTPTQAKALGLDTSAGAVKIPKAMTRVLNKTIDNRMAEIMGGKDVMRDFYKGTSASQSRVDFLTQQGVDASNMKTVKDKMSFMDFLRSKRKGGGRMAGGYMNKDSMPAYLSEGEYVMNNKAVRKYGLGFMGRLNGGVIPGFQEGGPVGGGANTAPLSSGMGATTNNISINVSVGGGGGQTQQGAGGAGNQNADQASNKDDATQGKELGEKIRAKVLEVISEEQRLGGSLSKTKRQG